MRRIVVFVTLVLVCIAAVPVVGQSDVRRLTEEIERLREQLKINARQTRPATRFVSPGAAATDAFDEYLEDLHRQRLENQLKNAQLQLLAAQTAALRAQTAAERAGLIPVAPTPATPQPSKDLVEAWNMLIRLVWFSTENVPEGAHRQTVVSKFMCLGLDSYRVWSQQGMLPLHIKGQDGTAYPIICE